jgi:hypothetical protein
MCGTRHSKEFAFLKSAGQIVPKGLLRSLERGGQVYRGLYVEPKDLVPRNDQTLLIDCATTVRMALGERAPVFHVFVTVPCDPMTAARGCLAH